MSRNKRRFKTSVRRQAFKLWVRYDGNFSAVSRHEGMPTVATISKWAEEDDWEGKLEQAKEETKELLEVHKNPLVKKMAEQGAFNVEALAIVQGIVLDTMKKFKKRMRPRSLIEAVQALRFVSEEYDKRMPRGKAGQIIQSQNMPQASLGEVLDNIFPDGDPESEEIKRQIRVKIRNNLRLVKAKTKEVASGS